MIRRIVECVANFSEGQNQTTVDHIKEAILAVPGVRIIGVHSDVDHNRTVISFLGTPDNIADAAFAAIRVAGERIDMDAHRGQHPRIGAADVVPFIPVQGVTMVECVSIAHNLGRRVGDELGIPVFLYEEAALRSDRRNLADVRRGEYESLKLSISSDPDRYPDCGPVLLGKAGAVAIGARGPLIAFNIYLNTGDVEVARRIAAVLRFSSGGLRYVKALGLLVNGRAQVSINVIDYAKNSLPLIVELVRREAARYGIMIEHTELVGLLPLQALIDASQWYLQLNEFSADQILETHLMDLD